MHEGSPAHRGLHMQGMCAYRVVENLLKGLCVLRGSVNEDEWRMGWRHEHRSSWVKGVVDAGACT